MMQRLLRMMVMVCAAILTAACDQSGRPIEEIGLSKLTRGLSSESDVRMVMGPPHSVWEEENGARLLEYPKGPEGPRTWFFRIDQFGKLQDYQQVLTLQNFARIKVGMNQEEVRRILGTPGSSSQFERKNEVVWDWRYLDGVDHKFFHVHFDKGTGLVTETSASQHHFG